MVPNRFGVLAGLLFAPAIFAQFDTQGAQVISYFPQLADGGPATQKWITSFTFLNSHSTLAANGIVSMYANDGTPLALDFGSGPVPSFNFTVPPQGTVTFRTSGAPATTLTGWAVASSTLPLQGVIQFRNSANGVPQQGVSAQATEASGIFRSPATPTTGIAIANIYAVPVALNVAVVDANGTNVVNAPVTLNPLGHSSFTLGQMFPSLPATFRGSVVITTTLPGNYCVAWTLGTDLGVLASYPPSGLSWPISHYQRIWKVWEKVLNAALVNFPSVTAPRLVIDYSSGQINSFAVVNLNEVHIFINLAELISDSESELAFVVGHEIGHIIQGKLGVVVIPSNIEQDADQYGAFLALSAGYDPYGAAGALAKLYMASGQAGLLAQDFDNLLSGAGLDPHGSFNNRLAVIFVVMQSVCATPQLQGFCALYKSVVHPHLPPLAPLVKAPPAP